jgi:tetratricopeptide (TPR) repeat protein
MRRDLDALQQRIRALSGRRAGFAAVLCGAAGIGKSHAAQAVLERAHCKTVFVRAVGGIAGLVAALGRPKRLSAWVERELEARPITRLEAVLALLEGLAPLAVRVEDLHECDAGTLEDWTGLAQGVARGAGVALLATSRTPAPAPFEEVTLRPLEPAASRALLENELGSGLPTEAATWIHARSAGNPLFALEFLRFLARRGFVWSDGTHWHWREPEPDLLPVTVEAMIERAIAEACPEPGIQTALGARAYVEGLAVNSVLEREAWAAVAGLEPAALQRAARALQSAGIVDATGFSHPLFREVPVRSLSPATKQAFARRALNVLPLEVAAVFVQDAQLGAQASLEWLQRAATASVTPGRWLALAVQYASGLTGARLALEAARLLAQSDMAQAEALYRHALEHLPEVHLEFIGFLCRHKHGEARALFDQLPAEVRDSPEGLSVRVNVMTLAGEHAAVVALWQDGFGSSAMLEPDVLVHVIWSLKCLTRFDDGIALAGQVLARSDLTPWQRARVMNRLAACYGESTRYTEALEIVGTLLAHLQTHGLAGRDVVLYDRALYRKQLGDYGSAVHDLEEALQVATEVGNTHQQMLCRSFLGSLYCELGRYPLAEELLLEAHGFLRHQPSSPYTADTLHNLTELYLGWTDRVSNVLLAQKYARLALEYSLNLNMPGYAAGSRVFAGWVELEHGSPRRALDLALEALALNVPADLFYGHWFPRWLEAKARSRLGQPSVALYEAVLKGLEGIGRIFEANQAGLELDRLQDHLDSARARLQWFRERDLQNALNAGRRLFPELQETAPVVPAAPQLLVLGGLRLNGEAVRGEKRQRLLVALLEARLQGQAGMSTLALCDAIYPDVTEPEAASALKQTVFKLRSSHGSSAVITTADGYALGEVLSDAAAFLRGGDTGLWRGPYLDGVPFEPNAVVLEVLTLGLQSRSEGLLHTDPREAARLGRIWLAMDPYDQRALGLACAALRALGNHRSLGRVYQEARARLLEVGEALPERWEAFLETGLAAQTP